MRKQVKWTKGLWSLPPPLGPGSLLCSGASLAVLTQGAGGFHRADGSLSTDSDADLDPLTAHTCSSYDIEQLVLYVLLRSPKSPPNLYQMPFFFILSSVAQSCLTAFDPRDCSLPGSSVHGILQARILEWVAVPFSRGSSRPRLNLHLLCFSCIGRQILYH